MSFCKWMVGQGLIRAKRYKKLWRAMSASKWIHYSEENQLIGYIVIKFTRIYLSERYKNGADERLNKLRNLIIKQILKETCFRSCLLQKGNLFLLRDSI